METKKETKTDAEKAATIREYQRQTIGSENFHREPGFAFVFSDGVKLLADECGGYWLLTAISSHQLTPKVRREEFQVWTMTHEPKNDYPNRWVLRAHDGNGKRIAAQSIGYSDFPEELSEFVLYLENQTLYLPEER